MYPEDTVLQHITILVVNMITFLPSMTCRDGDDISPEGASQAHPGAVHRGDPVPSVPSYLNTFFRNLVDPVVVTDALGQITYVNGPLEQMLDMQAEALVGRHITELFVYQGSFITTAGQAIELGSGSLEESLAKVKQLFEEEKINYEYYCQRRDGLAVPVEVSVTMLSENNEDCRGAIVILRDISKRIRAFQEARQTRAQFKNLIECSINPIVFSDTVGIIIDCNSAFCDMIGYGREEIIGHMVTEFSIMSEGEYETTTADKVTVGADSIIAARRHIEQLFSEGKVSGWEALYRRKDGKLVPTISNVVLLKDDAGNMTGSFGIVQDITRECVTERELTRTKDFLDNIIANS
ncbi:MAG: PAS domain S-box protein, partial [Deltaproteobacteria bacterium]|nr:PAS domain S-box protein [Deltaproteobacteria bacterium]